MDCLVVTTDFALGALLENNHLSDDRCLTFDGPASIVVGQILSVQCSDMFCHSAHSSNQWCTFNRFNRPT